MFDESINMFDLELRKLAKNNIIKKLQKQNLDYNALNKEAFNDLVNDEIDILKDTGKKIGIGAGIGLIISATIGI